MAGGCSRRGHHHQRLCFGSKGQIQNNRSPAPQNMHTSLMSSLLEAAQPVVTGAMNAPRSFLGVRDGIFQQREHPGKSPKVGMNWHF